jgi:hypothetical protein
MFTGIGHKWKVKKVLGDICHLRWPRLVIGDG